MRRRQGDLSGARELVDDIWEAAERGPYPLVLADALNILAEIERHAEETDGAIKAASRAFCTSWCDGPPFAYHWGLERAKKQLKELGAFQPKMAPYDENKFESLISLHSDSADVDAIKITLDPWEAYYNRNNSQ